MPRTVLRCFVLLLFYVYTYLAASALRCDTQDLRLHLAMRDLSSSTRDQTRVLCITRQILNHWAIREVPHAQVFWTCYLISKLCRVNLILTLTVYIWKSLTGVKPMSSASQSRFSNTGPPGKSRMLRCFGCVISIPSHKLCEVSLILTFMRINLKTWCQDLHYLTGCPWVESLSLSGSLISFRK